MRFAFGPKAQLEPSTNSTLWDLCWSQSTVFPSYKSVFLCNSSWVDSEASSLRFTKRTQWGYGFAHKWFLTCATMHIIFMSEMVLSHPSSMVESCSSSLWLMHGQIVSRENSTGLGHINILLDLSFTKDYRMLLCMIDMIKKILGLWNTNLFFLLLIWGVLDL